MSTKIGRFEIVSEIAKSSSGSVYKANDPDAGRTVALKTIRLALHSSMAPAKWKASSAPPWSTSKATAWPT
jgi:serine/threonine protein kinase